MKHDDLLHEHVKRRTALLMSKPIAVLILTLLALAAALTFSVRRANADGPLLNPGFEAGAVAYVDEWGNMVPEIELPVGWPLFVFEPNCGGGCMHRPETKLELATSHGFYRIYEGYQGWKAFTTYSTHRYWLGQRVSVSPGEQVAFSGYVMTWSSAFDNPYQSDQGSYRSRVGIDPTGGTDPRAESVVWSHPEPGFKIMDAWYQHQVEATAQGDQVTVWLEGWPEWALKHNDSHWDATALVVTGEPTPTVFVPTVTATATLVVPTATLTPKPTAAPPACDLCALLPGLREMVRGLEAVCE